MSAKITPFFILVFFVVVKVSGQDIHATGFFLSDTIKIGEKTNYVLLISYPKQEKIVLPDSLYTYGTFEFMGRTYAPTRSDDFMSFDSVVYSFATYEMDSIQFLQVPVYVLHYPDCLVVNTSLDSVVIHHLIQVLPDSLDLKASTTFVKVPLTVNYPLILVVAGILLILTVAILIFFGRRILAIFRKIIMKRAHRRFVTRFYFLLGRLSDGRPGEDPEHVLLQWKKYMEKLEKEPYTKLTTKEIIRLHNSQEIRESLRSIDRLIYGGVRDTTLLKDFEVLLRYSVDRYQERLKEL